MTTTAIPLGHYPAGMADNGGVAEYKGVADQEGVSDSDEELPPVELPGPRRRRLLRQFSKVARASLGTGLMGTLFTFPSVLASDLNKNPTSLYGTSLEMHGLQDFVGSLLMLSSLPGAWLTAAVAMHLGRRKSMMLCGAVAVVGWLCVALIPSIGGILAARCISGLALGGLSVVVNAYVAELSDDDVRGMMSMALNLAILLGQIFTVALGYGLRFYMVAFLNALVPAAFVLFLIWLPESPSVLVLKNKDDKAREVLLELRGLKADVSGEIQSYRAFNQQQGSEGGAWRQLLKRDVLKNLAVVSSLFILVTFTGFLVVNANAVQMLEAAGSPVDPELGAILLMLVQFVGGVAGFFLMDKIGRKNILYVGFSLMVLCLGGLAAYSGVRIQMDPSQPSITTTTTTTSAPYAPMRLPRANPTTTTTTPKPLVRAATTTTTTTATTTATITTTPTNDTQSGSSESWGWIPFTCLLISQTSVALGVNVMPFILNQEYFPTAIRSQASGICFTVYTLANFAVLQAYTPMVTNLTQAGLYGFYAAICLISLPFTFFFVRETMGEAVG